MSEEIEKVAGLIKDAEMVVALTGAGISVESGIPDFRSPGGLWSRYDPAVYGTYEAFVNDPSKFWELARELNPLLEGAKPNPAHLALAELERLGKCEAVITQNIDHLHQEAGSTTVLELHGTYGTATCLKCERKHELEEIKKFVELEKIPTCTDCGGVVKPDVVLFGEPLPSNTIAQAVQLAMETSLMLVIGTSLEVVPAASLPIYTRRSGGKLAFFNDTGTAYDQIADVVVYGLAGVTLPAVVSVYKELVED